MKKLVRAGSLACLILLSVRVDEVHYLGLVIVLQFPLLGVLGEGTPIWDNKVETKFGIDINRLLLPR